MSEEEKLNPYPIKRNGFDPNRVIRIVGVGHIKIPYFNHFTFKQIINGEFVPEHSESFLACLKITDQIKFINCLKQYKYHFKDRRIVECYLLEHYDKFDLEESIRLCEAIDHPTYPKSLIEDVELNEDEKEKKLEKNDVIPIEKLFNTNYTLDILIAQIKEDNKGYFTEGNAWNKAENQIVALDGVLKQKGKYSIFAKTSSMKDRVNTLRHLFKLKQIKDVRSSSSIAFNRAKEDFDQSIC